jgi:hypothetical protein
MGKTPAPAISNKSGQAIAGARGTAYAGMKYDTKTGKWVKLAKGGTVMPSTGGSIVNVAEAGKPERIEPLAPNGLSSRDVAIIEKLSGKSGGGNTIQINVYGTPGMDINDLADQVGRKVAFNIGRGKY